MRIKTAAVAGHFYPDDKHQLQTLIANLLADNPSCAPIDFDDKPDTYIVPHAAPRFSGAIASLAYNRIKPYLDCYQRIVILGPAHRVAFNDHAALDAEAWQTPLGTLRIDSEYNNKLIQLGLVQYFNRAHAQEHSIEVQLPFLQSIGVSDQLPIVPIVIGHAPRQKTASLIDFIRQDNTSLLLISSDLSHFKTYQQAVDFDNDTLNSINKMSADLVSEQACGCHPINGLLASNAQITLASKQLGYCNSGDTGGDKQRVVGYAAIAFEKIFNRSRKQLLLQLARRTLTNHFEQATDSSIDQRLLEHQQYLDKELACFVTLNTLSLDANRQRQTVLRGCIGNLQPRGSLIESIKRNVCLAALNDARFQPVTQPELDDINIEISVLTPERHLHTESHNDLIRQLRPGVDGLILKFNNQQATFLPSVWSQVSDPQVFVSHLKIKAGLAKDFWHKDMQCFIYQAIKFSEGGE